jgi:hypothetical protein
VQVAADFGAAPEGVDPEGQDGQQDGFQVEDQERGALGGAVEVEVVVLGGFGRGGHGGIMAWRVKNEKPRSRRGFIS